MADDTLEVIIKSSGGEQVVATFKASADAAKQMGTTVEQANQKAGRSSEEFSKRMAALGGSLTTAAGFLADWSRSSQDADAIQRQLEASIEATGESYEQYADRVEAAGAAAVRLGQDDEAASQAISALTQITGSATVALDQMGLVLDLAAAKHLSLESSAELIGRAYEGNTATLARYGIVVREGASAEETLAQIQQQVAGQAEASATTYGRLREEFSNLTDEIGGTAGEFAPLLAMLPGASVGFSAVGSAVGALGLSLGPLGIVAAVGVAAIAIDRLIDGTNEFEASAGTATVVANDFAEALVKLKTGGSDATDEFGQVSQAFADLLTTQIEAVELATAGAVDKISNEQANEIKDAIIGIFANPFVDETKVTPFLLQLFDEFGKGTRDAESLTRAIQDANTNWAPYAKGVDQAATKTKDFTSAISVLDSALGDMNEIRLSPGLLQDIETIKEFGSPDAKAAFESYVNQFKRTGDMAQLEGQVDSIADRVEAQSAGVVRATAAMKRQEAAAYSMATAQKTFTTATQEQTAAQAAAESKMIALEGAAYSMAGAQQAVTETTNETRDELVKATTELQGYANALVGTISLAAQLRPLDITVSGGDKVTGTADEAIRAGNSLQGVLDIFKQIKGMGKAQEDAGSIAETLIGNADEAGKAVELLEQGRISQTRYNMTLEAGNNILGRTEEVQSDLAVIQAKQLPFLDQASAKYADVIDDISHMTTEQQAATLGFMDTNLAMQAQNALALAAAAANTEVGSTARQAAEASIEGAIAAEPYLEAMLTQIGLVSRDHEGNLVVNFDNADALNASTDALTEAIENLTLAIQTLDGTSANPSITVSGVQPALDAIGQVGNALDNLNGKTATTYSKTVTIGEPTTGSMLGGVIGYANGGTIRARLGEAGYELVNFQNGGVGLAPQDGYYNLMRGDFITPHPESQAKLAMSGGGGVSLTFNNYGPINGFADLEAFFEEGRRAFDRAFAGLGA